MKRGIAAVLVLVLLLPLAACGQETEEDPVTSLRIGIAMYDSSDTYIKELVNSFQGFAKEVQREQNITISVITKNADSSQALQNSQVETLIEEGCDILCVNLVDRTDASVIIDRALAEDIPIIFFNRELVEEDLMRSDTLYYVGADALDSGVLQGQIVVDQYRADPQRVDRNGDGVVKYVMLEGEAGHQDAILRTEWSVNTVTGAGIELERLEDEIANWSFSQAKSRMNQFIQTHGTNIELVFCNNDEMALGVVDALMEAEVRQDHWPVIVGIDGTGSGLEAVQNGLLTGTVYQDGRGQAQAMLEIALAVLTGSEFPEAMEDGKYVRLPHQIVTIDNVDEYLQ